MATQAEDLELGDDEWRRGNYDAAYACYRRVVDGPDQGVHWQTGWDRLAKLAEDRRPVWGCTSFLYHKENCPAWNATNSWNRVHFANWRQAWESGRRPHVGPGGIGGCKPFSPKTDQCPKKVPK
jgi:hypothetical protein